MGFNTHIPWNLCHKWFATILGSSVPGGLNCPDSHKSHCSFVPYLLICGRFISSHQIIWSHIIRLCPESSGSDVHNVLRWSSRNHLNNRLIGWSELLFWQNQLRKYVSLRVVSLCSCLGFWRNPQKDAESHIGICKLHDELLELDNSPALTGSFPKKKETVNLSVSIFPCGFL